MHNVIIYVYFFLLAGCSTSYVVHKYKVDCAVGDKILKERVSNGSVVRSAEEDFLSPLCKGSKKVKFLRLAEGSKKMMISISPDLFYDKNKCELTLIKGLLGNNPRNAQINTEWIYKDFMSFYLDSLYLNEGIVGKHAHVSTERLNSRDEAIGYCKSKSKP